MTTAAFLEDIMSQSFRTIVVSSLTLIVSSILATAAEVRVLTVGSTQIAARAIATELETLTCHKVTFTIRPTRAGDAAELAFVCEQNFISAAVEAAARDHADRSAATCSRKPSSRQK